MAEGKFDLPDDLLSCKPSDHCWTPKVEALGSDEEKVSAGLHDETKDQLASESSMPLSPQWLYSKPSETKMDMRALTSVSLGNSNDPSQKDGWRLDGTEDKKDWRRIATENESNRRWREEERETGILGSRRDRRKADRVSIRETLENRVLPSPDRWHEGNNRNSGHEARRDSKWSSRWGPEDKEKESRTEKRTDVDKEKDDSHYDNQSSIISNRSASDRDSDSRDKWRPRHRMEVHSTGSNSYRAAPGFGLERGRGEGSNLGFTIGRGRSNAITRSSSAATTIAPHAYKSGSVIGKPNLAMETFCYPRGKLLDIYRRQKLDSSFSAMPDEMEESLPITQVDIFEPLAFVAPDAEEEVILTDIWKGKLTSSGVVYNSFRKGRSTENVSGAGDYESNEGKLGILSSVPSEESPDTFQGAANNSAYQTDGDHSLWNHDSHLNVLHEKDVDHEGNKVRDDEFTATDLECVVTGTTKEIITSSHGASQLDIGENGQRVNSALTRHFHSDDVDSASSFDVKSKLPDDSNSLFVLPSTDQDCSVTMLPLASKSEAKDLERSTPLEDLYFYYIDPHGNTQGPFLGADIILWFEEGYFGTDLPVRLADAPEDTSFQSLGDIMPHLKLRGMFPSSLQEPSSASGGKLEPGLPPAAPENTDSAAVNELCQPMSDLSSLSAQHVQSRMPEPKNPLQFPHSEDQSFLDFVAHDEEIVFPGRPGSSGYPIMQPSGNAHDPLAKSNGHPSFPDELTEPGLPYQSDNKLHPFGLFWSELEGSQSQTRQIESSDMPSTVGRPAAFGAMPDRAAVAEKWSDVYGQEMLSVPNSFQDATAARHLSRVEQEPNHFGLAEQLMSRQFQQQQQLQQRNMLSHSHLNDSLLEHVTGQNLIHHQQLANHPVPDVEHLLALQLQQQRQLQLQQQQQQFHQQQKLLQERQQSQARQVLLEQLLHGQMPDPALVQSRVDPIRANNVLDQVLLEQQLLHELQQRSQHPQRHFVPSVEQLAQAKFGQALQQDQQRDLFELLSHAQHGQIQSLEHQILQEQLQARQLPMGLRQRMNMEEERHIESLWPPVNESDQFFRSLTGNHRAHSSGISPLDFYQQQQQQQQRPPHEDQLSQLERNLSFQDRLRQGLYEPGSLLFERSLSLPAGASGMNMDVVNAMACAHGLDMQELSTRMQSAGQVGTLSSGNHPHDRHHPMVPNQFHVSHLDAIEGRWPESNGPIVNDWMESRIQQLHINAERRKRESDIKVTAEDSSLWMSDGLNDDKSRRLFMELLHQKSGHQPSDSVQMNDGMSFEKKSASGIYSGSSSSDHLFAVVSDQEASLNNSLAIGSYGSNTCQLAEVSSAGERASNMGNTEKLLLRSESGATCGGNLSLLGISETSQAVLADSNFIDKSSINREYLDVEGRKYGSKMQGMAKSSVTEIHNGIGDQARLTATDHGEVTVNVLGRHSSLGVPGCYDDKIGQQNSFAEDINMNQVPVLFKGQESILLRRPPVSHASSSQEGLSELAADTVVRAKSSSGVEGGNLVSQGSDSTASGKTDVHFRRTSSCGDADVSEPSFIDMLKSNAKKNIAPEAHMTAAGSESSDGTQGGRSGKKKGKKGRQIDPALLGFKVTSNRIMMGEIQRIED
ncbi:hypothetical protein P3X46_011485 [Hevea brasiliensis]|uniref:GYF domain-containing protein n=1 Tax=Hevea brasiliensis TaxID=3981 RepID=A0ABQ9MAY5_HEVBR|nr:protein ESSENTIAL FOR POTEXVIRUS ACCUMULATION 1 isoform X2 [Hevea brasiliensis]KAJ9176140.1 hypothetical protein P3X46_011485 [Hevea brasiliensis]